MPDICSENGILPLFPVHRECGMSQHCLVTDRYRVILLNLWNKVLLMVSDYNTKIDKGYVQKINLAWRILLLRLFSKINLQFLNWLSCDWVCLKTIEAEDLKVKFTKRISQSVISETNENSTVAGIKVKWTACVIKVLASAHFHTLHFAY